MKTLLKKGSLQAGAGMKLPRPALVPAKPVPAKPARPPANPYKVTNTSGESNSLIWIAVGLAAFVAVVAIIMFAGRRPQENTQVIVAQPTPPPAVQRSSVGVGEPDPALGGLTMAEYMAKHEKDSPELQARRARIKNRPER